MKEPCATTDVMASSWDLPIDNYGLGSTEKKYSDLICSHDDNV